MAKKLMLIQFSVADGKFVALAEQPPELFFEPIPVGLWLKTAAVVAVAIGWWVMLIGGIITGRLVWTLVAAILLLTVTGVCVAYLKWKEGKP